jgi:hypothetical protein
MFSRILLWRDRVRNGLTEPGELITASQAGIVAFETHYEESRRVDTWGNKFRYRGRVLFRSALFSRHSWDVFLLGENTE